MTDPSGVPVPGGQPTTTAVRTVAGRIFLLNNPMFTDSVPDSWRRTAAAWCCAAGGATRRRPRYGARQPAH
jgi:hypothetical protein